MESLQKGRRKSSKASRSHCRTKMLRWHFNWVRPMAKRKRSRHLVELLWDTTIAYFADLIIQSKWKFLQRTTPVAIVFFRATSENRSMKAKLSSRPTSRSARIYCRKHNLCSSLPQLFFSWNASSRLLLLHSRGFFFGQMSIHLFGRRRARSQQILLNNKNPINYTSRSCWSERSR